MSLWRLKNLFSWKKLVVHYLQESAQSRFSSHIRWILREQDDGMLTGVMWFRVGPVAGCCGHKRNVGFYKIWTISWVAEQCLASQKGLWCMRLVILLVCFQTTQSIGQMHTRTDIRHLRSVDVSCPCETLAADKVTESWGQRQVPQMGTLSVTLNVSWCESQRYGNLMQNLWSPGPIPE